MGFAFMSENFASLTEKHLDIQRKPLPFTCCVRGYDGASPQTITSFLSLTLHIAGRVQRQVPFLILKLHRHDLILGKRWGEKSKVLLDCHGEQIIWKEPLNKDDISWERTLAINAQDLRDKSATPQHQKDMFRRDRKLDHQIQTQAITLLHRPTHKQDTHEQYLRMDKILQENNDSLIAPPSLRRTPPPAEVEIDVRLISAEAFQMVSRQPTNKVFDITLNEIDTMIEDKERLADIHRPLHERDCQPGETEEQWLKRVVPKQYQEYHEAFSKEASNMVPPNQPWDHKIETDGEQTLGYCPLWRQSPQELRATKQYIVENLDKGFIEASYSPFAAPVLFVHKPDGSLRFCVDYRKLNAITKKDRYPLPLIDETLQRLSRAKIFTKLDIRQAFHRIRMDPASEDLTTFRTRYGSYKYKVLPFGLTNGPATYQRYMNNVLFDYLDVFCTAYMDDILIYSENPLEHEAHVRKVLQRLKDAGLQADIVKSEFHVMKTKYLGFIISTDGVAVDPAKIAVIKNWKAPKTVKGIQSFLGFCNFYRRFIAKYGCVARPLTLQTRKNIPFKFDTACQEAFDKLKDALIQAPILVYFRYDREHMLETDSSDGVTAAILSEQDPETRFWHPVAFTSKTMAPAEINYPIHDKELLAIIRAFEEWEPELIGHTSKLPVYSDHKALEYFMTTKQLSARQVRWAEYVSRFHFEIMFRAGTKNSKADALTRRDQDIEEQDVLMKKLRQQTLLQPSQISKEVAKDLDLPSTPIQLSPILQDAVSLVNQLLESNRQAPELEDLREKASKEADRTWQIHDGLLLRNGKLVVPDTQWNGQPIRTALIREAHDQKSVGHAGRGKTSQLLKDRYYWNGLGGQVAQYIRNCHICRRSHVPRDKTPGLLQPLSIPERPWQHITVDFKSFPTSKNGYDMIVVFVDRLSKRAVSIPCYKTVTAKDLATIFLVHIYRYYGAPESVVSDRGPQFISTFWDEFCNILGIKLKLSTANHAQTDGQTEIVNQYIDQRLRPFVAYFQDDWDELLPMADFAQASLPHESTGQSPIFTEMGYEPRFSLEWKSSVKPSTAKEKLNRNEAKDLLRRIHNAWKVAQENMKNAQVRHTRQANKKRREIDFDINDKVWVSTKHWKTNRPSKKLAEQMAGPFKILARKGNAFEVDLPASIKVHPVFNADKLRKASNDPLEGQINDEPPPIVVEGEHEWEVEKILSVRLVHGQLKYKVKWLGFDEDLDEYLASNFRYAPQALTDFHNEYPDLPGPPKNLAHWVKAALDETEPEKRVDDNKPVDRRLQKGGVVSRL